MLSEAEASATKRRASPRGAAARERILNVAQEAFSERGYRGASLNEIAKSANLSMAGLLHHFASKDDLFAAVLQRREDLDIEMFSGLASADAGFAETLDAFAAMARMNMARYSFVQLTHLIAAESAPGGHPATETSRTHYRIARAYVADALHRSIARGEVQADVNVELISLQVVAMVEGLQNQWLHESEVIDYASAFESWAADLKAALLLPQA